MGVAAVAEAGARNTFMTGDSIPRCVEPRGVEQGVCAAWAVLYLVERELYVVCVVETAAGGVLTSSSGCRRLKREERSKVHARC